MDQTAIFWPVLLQIAVTLLLYVLTFRVRVRLIKSGEAQTGDFRTYENEVPESRKWARAIANQFELPVLFYVMCIGVAVLGKVDMVMLALAWAFSVGKCLHVYLHVTANRLRYRQPVFSICFLVAVLMMVWFALQLAELV